jgi:hypothetical protein
VIAKIKVRFAPLLVGNVPYDAYMLKEIIVEPPKVPLLNRL